VVKGYTPKEGKDFFDTYSPVIRLITIHVLLSLATSHCEKPSGLYLGLFM
jgi:hypothetical protein